MKRKKLKKIVNKHIDFMLWDMQLNDWDIAVEYGNASVGLREREGGGYAACVSMQPEYEKALITLDPDYHHSEKDVLESLRHELIHLLHSDFALYRDTVGEFIERDSAAWSACDLAYQTACEKTALRIERMLDHGYKIPLGKRDVKYESPSPYDQEQPEELRSAA